MLLVKVAFNFLDWPKCRTLGVGHVVLTSFTYLLSSAAAGLAISFTF